MSYVNQSGRNRQGKIPTVRLPVTFEAGQGFVTMVFHAAPDMTIGVKFESPDQMLGLFTQLMETAVMVWPNDPFIRYYLSEED